MGLIDATSGRARAWMARGTWSGPTGGQDRAAGLVAMLATCLALVACGGGGSSDTAPTASDHVVTLDHGAFHLRYDCDLHSTLRYDYVLDVDTGNAARPTLFHLDDPTLPPGCGQQTSAATYASVAPGWDRGHLVTANHMDQSDAVIASTFYMTNVVPQRAAFNEGIWADAEAIAECYRDLAPVQVVGGLVYDDSANDLFVRSHGIATPDWFWKVLITTERASGAMQVIAWLIPNDVGLGALDNYLVSVAMLEARVGADAVAMPGLAADLKSQHPAASWPLPVGCKPG
jgi:endonuclease G